MSAIGIPAKFLTITDVGEASDCVAKLTDGARWLALGNVRAWCFALSAAGSGDRRQALLLTRARHTQHRRLAPSAVVVRHTWRAFSNSGRTHRPLGWWRGSHRPIIAAPDSDCVSDNESRFAAPINGVLQHNQGVEWTSGAQVSSKSPLSSK